MKQTLFIGNLGGGELFIILLVLLLFLLVPFFLGYFIGLAKGRKEQFKRNN